MIKKIKKIDIYGNPIDLSRQESRGSSAKEEKHFRGAHWGQAAAISLGY